MSCCVDGARALARFNAPTALNDEAASMPRSGIRTQSSRFARLLHGQTLLNSTDCDEEKFQCPPAARRPDFAGLREKPRGRRDHAWFPDEKRRGDHQRRIAG